MKDEIKEIVETLKSHNDIVKEYPLTLSIEEQKLLLDYITNLQEERNMFKESFETMSKNYFEEKSRNEKAIECIKNFLCTEEYIKVDGIAISDNYLEILNILQGEDKDV